MTMPGTPLPFSPKEVRLIREMLSTSGEIPVCLLCEGKLHVSELAERSGEPGRVWRVDCVACRRTAIVTEGGGDRRVESSEQ
jgi:hypothetical protein